MEKGNNLNTYKFSQRSGTDLYKFNNLKSENNTNNQGKQKQKSVNRNSNNIPSKQKILYNFSRKNSSVSNINLLSPINKYQQNFINFLDEHNLNSQTNYFLKKYYQLSKNQKKHSNKSANSSNLIPNTQITTKNKKINKSPVSYINTNYKNINKLSKKKEKLSKIKDTNTIRITEYYSSLRKVNRNKTGYNKSFLYLSGDETNLSIKNATTANTSNNIKNIVNEIKLETSPNTTSNNNEILIEIDQLLQSKKGINNKLLKLNELNFDFPLYPNSKNEQIKENPFSIIESYCMNSYKGLCKDINEDNIISLINIKKPENYIKSWPNFLSYFGIFDGHCGITCSEYLKKNLHKVIFNNEFFPSNPIKAIEYSFNKIEEDFYLHNDKSESGSCALICLFIDDMCYIANCGDSRAILSNNNGKKYRILTNDHNLNNENEKKRIENNGSLIYQEKIPLNQYIVNEKNNVNFINNNNIYLLGPYRINPGGLSITRSIGDFSSKILSYGGIPNTVISTPEIISYKINHNCDFIIMGSDGIFNVLKNMEIVNIICEIKDNKKEYLKSADLIVKNALKRNSTDNLSCIVIFFKNNYDMVSFKERDSIDINHMYMETETYDNDEKKNFFGDLNDYCHNNNLSKFISSPKTTKNKCYKNFTIFGNLLPNQRNHKDDNKKMKK